MSGGVIQGNAAEQHCGVGRLRCTAKALRLRDIDPPDLSTGTVVQVAALAGNITINAPTNRANITAGTNGYSNRINVILQQDGTGARTVTWNAVFGTTSAINSASGSYSIWEFIWISGMWRQVSFSSGF